MNERVERLQQLQQRAQHALNQMRDPPPTDALSVDELVHELHIYQVELKLQNEELLTAQHDLKQSHQEFEMLFEAAPVGYLILDEAGRVQRANHTATNQLADGQRAALVGQAITRYIVPGDQDMFYLHWRSLQRTRTQQTAELSFKRADGSNFYAQVESVPRPSTGDPPSFLMTISDISVHKQYEKRLQGLHTLDQAILHAYSADEMLYLTLHHLLALTHCTRAHILVFSEERERIRVYTQTQGNPDVATQDKPADEIQNDLLPAHPQTIQRKGENAPVLLTHPLFQADTHIGSIWLEASHPHQFPDDVIPLVEGVVRQVSTALLKVKLFQQVQQRAEEKTHRVDILEERQRLASDLHDAVTQVLFALNLAAEALADVTKGDPDKRTEMVESIITLARGAQADMRLLLLELRPTKMQQETLGDLLNKLVLGFKGRQRRQIKLMVDDDLPDLPQTTKTHLYRIAQEALANIMKHTRRGDITIRAQQQDDRLILRVMNRGKGFDVGAVSGSGGGLSIMRERAAKIGASLNVTSEPQSGTQVEVVLPL